MRVIEFDNRLAVQLQDVFEKLIQSQTPVEPEFYPALYQDRSDMYALF